MNLVKFDYTKYTNNKINYFSFAKNTNVKNFCIYLGAWPCLNYFIKFVSYYDR